LRIGETTQESLRSPDAVRRIHDSRVIVARLGLRRKKSRFGGFPAPGPLTRNGNPNIILGLPSDAAVLMIFGNAELGILEDDPWLVPRVR
jgi:hypothetical protein